MQPIAVPKPNSVRDPNRSAGALLLAQVRHLAVAFRQRYPRLHPQRP